MLLGRTDDVRTYGDANVGYGIEYGYSVMENKSPHFLQAFGYPELTTNVLYVGIILAVSSFALNWRKFRDNVFGFILVIATALFALVMVRNFALFALCLMPPVINNTGEMRFHYHTKWPLRWVILVWCLLFGTAIVTGQFYGQYGAPYRQFGFVVPAGFVAGCDVGWVLGASFTFAAFPFRPRR